MANYSRLQCFFCKRQNPSYAEECGSCRALTLPTTDESGKKLTWTFYGFGSEAPSVMRTSTSFFNDALASLDDSGRFAIFLGDKNSKYLLVKVPGAQSRYAQKVQDTSTNENDRIVIKVWNDDPAVFHRIVRETLDADEFISRKQIHAFFPNVFLTLTLYEETLPWFLI